VMTPTSSQARTPSSTPSSPAATTKMTSMSRVLSIAKPRRTPRITKLRSLSKSLTRISTSITVMGKTMPASPRRRRNKNPPLPLLVSKKTSRMPTQRPRSRKIPRLTMMMKCSWRTRLRMSRRAMRTRRTRPTTRVQRNLPALSFPRRLPRLKLLLSLCQSATIR